MAMSEEDLREVGFDHEVEGKKRGVFVAVTAWVKAYEHYEDPTMSREMHEALHPMVLMVPRWDGQNGFVGGFDDGPEQIQKEAMEEAGLDMAALPRPVPLIAHETPWIIVRLYHVDLGELTEHEARVIQARAAMAEHAVAEGAASWRHLSNYRRGKGWETLRRGCLATAVGPELDALRARLYERAPEGAWPADPVDPPADQVRAIPTTLASSVC